jgi:hypothetical protein
MKRIFGLAAAAVLLAASPATAQRGGTAAEIEDAVRESGVIEAVEELAVALGPELERIAESVARVALRVSEDPELRRSVLRAALGGVEIAEVVMVEHMEIVREALRDASEELERMGREMRRS